MKTPRRKLIWWFTGALIVFMVFGNRGFRQLTGTFREKRRMDKALASLRSERERLSRELGWIQQDPAYTEYLIRKNLGYVRKGEVEYRLIKPGQSRPPEN